jgi:hypothetical protein
VRWLAAGRDSKQLDFNSNLLTSLLSDSIGGTALTLMFVCISPSDYDREATMDTLKFAIETGKIVNVPGIVEPRQQFAAIAENKCKISYSSCWGDGHRVDRLKLNFLDPRERGKEAASGF